MTIAVAQQTDRLGPIANNNFRRPSLGDLKEPPRHLTESEQIDWFVKLTHARLLADRTTKSGWYTIGGQFHDDAPFTRRLTEVVGQGYVEQVYPVKLGVKGAVWVSGIIKYLVEKVEEAVGRASRMDEENRRLRRELETAHQLIERMRS